MDKKRDFTIVGIFVVAIFGILLLQNFNLTGEASRNVVTQVELDEDEYLFVTGERKVIEDVPVTLLRIADSNEVIVDVSGVSKSINEYGARVINNVQIGNMAVSDTGALLKIINLEKIQTTCVDSDLGDTFVRGKCDDRFYPDGVEDFCDFNTLREYNCGYDVYVDEVHCLKHLVECSDGCINGACISG